MSENHPQMDSGIVLTHPAEVRQLLARRGIRPSRFWGQNFLVDRNILRILLTAAELQPQDEVVEVGAGLGVLTEALLEQARTVIAVEKDRRLAVYLRERFAGQPRLTLLEADILSCDLPALFGGTERKLVANLPYAVAARLLVELTALPRPPARIVVTVQQEVAMRILAAPATADYGLLSILMQRHYQGELIKRISPTCFWPPPAVQSALVRLVRRAEPLGGAVPEASLRHLLHTAFSQRRKTLARSLKDLTAEPLSALALAQIPPKARPEEVPPDAWPTLLRALPAPPVPTAPQLRLLKP